MQMRADGGGRWSDADCDKSRNFICEKPALGMSQ